MCLDYVKKTLTINLPNGSSQMGSCSCQFENKECQRIHKASSLPTGWPMAGPSGTSTKPSGWLPAPNAAAWSRQHPGQSLPAWSPCSQSGLPAGPRLPPGSGGGGQALELCSLPFILTVLLCAVGMFDGAHCSFPHFLLFYSRD